MRYMLLINSPEQAPSADATPEQIEAEMAPWIEYTNAMVEAGVFQAGDPLQGPETATTIRVRDGETLTTDGPFAETKEVLGGYYILDVEDVDEAIEWARRCPAAEYGSIELRPISEVG